ncbi:MAG: hypothetical protein NWR72_18685 [Bacteroidia bacterium]|nr:hypothetical protein [Bacteroidia bacterium]
MSRFSFAAFLLCFGSLLCCLSLPLSAQTEVQRLRTDLDQMDNGTAKVLKLISGSRAVFDSNQEGAITYAKQAITMAASLGLKEERGLALSNLGFLYYKMKAYDQVISHLEQTTTWRNQNLSNTSDNLLELARDYRLIGNAWEEKGRLDKAYEAYQSGVGYAIRSKNAEETAFAYNRMGEVQIKLENFQKAITHYNQALPIARTSGNASLRRTVEKNVATSVVLLQNYLEKQQIQMEVEEVQSQIQGVRDSLSSQMDSNKVLISTTNLLNIERRKDSAVIKAQLLEVANKDALLDMKEAQQETMYLAGIAVTAFLFLIILFLYNRARLRKKAKEAVEHEKQKSEELLFNILPTDIAKELIAKNVVKPREHDQVSILFTDFKGFTDIASKLTPDQLIKELNYVFNYFDHIVDQYGLEKIKTIGDAYMAVGGLQAKNSDHAIDTVAAALEMQAFMHKWKVEKEMRGEVPWELRVGVNSGSVVAGVIGNKKFAYDVWGDAVNIASRMEAAGEAWEVNISEDTHQLIRGKASCIARGPLPVKNKGSIPMYFVKQITSPRRNMTPATTAPSPIWRS